MAFNQTFTLRDDAVRHAVQIAMTRNILMVFWQNGPLWETETYAASPRMDVVTARYVLPRGEIVKLS